MNLKSAALGAGLLLLLGGVAGAESPRCEGAPAGAVAAEGNESQGCNLESGEGCAVAGEFEGEEAGFQDRMQELMQNNEWDKALTLAEQKKTDVAAEAEADFDLLRFLILVLKKDEPAVRELAAKLGEKHVHNADMLNEIAWQIAAAEGFKERDLALAEKLAARACELSESANAAVFDTLARIAFLKGDKEEAVDLQQQAIANAAEDQAEELTKTLESYKNGVLPAAETVGAGADALQNHLAELLAKCEENREGEDEDGAAEAGVNGADPDHYVQTIVFPTEGTVMVADGEFEAENQGSYSVRLYAPEDSPNRPATLMDGIICKREYGLLDEVLVADLNGDGQKEIVILFRNLDKDGALSADAFRVAKGKIERVVSVTNQNANADIVTLLAFKLKPAAPGTSGWFEAVEAAVCVLDDTGHGPTVGSPEWLAAVDQKLFPNPAAGEKKSAVGSKKWCKAVDKALFAGMR